MSDRKSETTIRKRATDQRTGNSYEFDVPPLALAVPVGDWSVVVVHMDGSSERFDHFPSEHEAAAWAMIHRDGLGLTRCASWRVELCK